MIESGQHTGSSGTEMPSRWRHLGPGLAAGLILFGCFAVLLRSESTDHGAGSTETPRIATTNSYLEAAVLDVLGKPEPIMRLAEPGMCPGHFDVRPSQIRELGGCRLLLRFGFQQGLDRKLAPLAKDGLDMIAIETTGGLCVPSTYLDVCRRVTEVLLSAGLLRTQAAEASLDRIENRLNKLEVDLKQRIEQAKMTGTPVVASFHQEAFCTWLGLNVVAKLTAADTALVSEINQAIAEGEHAKVGYIIANRPEGRGLADALADRLAACVVMFDNFPGEHEGRVSFERLVTENVDRLIAAQP